MKNLNGCKIEAVRFLRPKFRVSKSGTKGLPIFRVDLAWCVCMCVRAYMHACVCGATVEGKAVECFN